MATLSLSLINARDLKIASFFAIKQALYWLGRCPAVPWPPAYTEAEKQHHWLIATLTVGVNADIFPFNY